MRWRKHEHHAISSAHCPEYDVFCEQVLKAKNIEEHTVAMLAHIAGEKRSVALRTAARRIGVISYTRWRTLRDNRAINALNMQVIQASRRFIGKLRSVAATRARGCYQQGLCSGHQQWSGADLRGTAKTYAARYAKSRMSLIQRLNLIGFRTIMHDGRRVLVWQSPSEMYYLL